MGWKDLFKKKAKAPSHDITNLSLADLRPGFMIDYDMKTWQVAGFHTYDWGEDDKTFEWQLKSHDDIIYFELEPGDEDYLSISRKIPIGKIGTKTIDHIKTHGDPPDEITLDGNSYYLEESGGGHFLENGEGPGKELLKWDFADDAGKNFLSIEQWSETDFEAAVGFAVEEYQFTNILPGESTIA
jgi:Domain of unknown function (DUF4178)